MVDRHELMLKFADLPDEGHARRIRGVALAAALEWRDLLPDTKLADLALDQLVLAAETACEALGA